MMAACGTHAAATGPSVSSSQQPQMDSHRCLEEARRRRRRERAWICISAGGKRPTKDGSHPDREASPSPSGAQPIHSPIIIQPSTAKDRQPLQRTSYRRKALSDEELQERKEQLKRQHKEEEARRRRLAESPSAAEPLLPPVLLIDAYNVINADATMQSYMGVGETLEFARGELETRVQAYASASRATCVIVYDAMTRFQQGVPAEEQNTKEDLDERVSRVFCSAMEADSYIIEEARKLKVAGYTRIEVVSNDRRVRDEAAMADLKDWAVTSVDATSFAQILTNVGSVTPRVWDPSPLDEEALQAFERGWGSGRTAGGTAGAPDLEVILPLVNAPEELEEVLMEELGDRYEQAVAAPPPRQADEPAALADTAALSADLNSLFAPRHTRQKKRHK